MIADLSNAPSTEISEQDKRSMLLGADESLQACISTAEGKSEIEECELDYDTLVSSGASIYDEPGDSECLSICPVVLVGAVAVIAGLQLIPH